MFLLLKLLACRWRHNPAATVGCSQLHQLILLYTVQPIRTQLLLSWHKRDTAGSISQALIHQLQHSCYVQISLDRLYLRKFICKGLQGVQIKAIPYRKFYLFAIVENLFIKSALPSQKYTFFLGNCFYWRRITEASDDKHHRQANGSRFTEHCLHSDSVAGCCHSNVDGMNWCECRTLAQWYRPSPPVALLLLKRNNINIKIKIYLLKHIIFSYRK